MAVLTGSSIANPVLGASGSERVSFEALEGQTYHICVSDYFGHTGGIMMMFEVPIVEVPSVKMLRPSSKLAILRYAAAPGQVILLVRSDTGRSWQGVQTAVARGGTVDFLVRPAPTNTGPYYRGVNLDRFFEIRFGAGCWLMALW